MRAARVVCRAQQAGTMRDELQEWGLSRRIDAFVRDGYTSRHSQFLGRVKKDLWKPSSPKGEGYIVLSIAENKAASVCDPLAAELSKPVSFAGSSLGYDDYKGNGRLRSEVALYVNSTMGPREDVLAEHVCVSAGCGSCVENLVFAICDPGEQILIPAPYYSSFDRDLGMRPDVRPVPVHSSTAAGDLNPSDFEAAFNPARTKAVILTNPHNPLGRVYTAAELGAVATWAIEKGLHVVCDEIYANSCYGSGARFVSLRDLDLPFSDQTVRKHVHVVFGFSKDFGCSGLRVGCVHTRNEAVIRAWDLLGYSCLVSTHTQHVFSELLSDASFVARHLEANRSALLESYEAVSGALAAAGIPHCEAQAGMFVWIDLRDKLQGVGFEAERALWQSAATRAKVILTPGESCHSKEPGFFRLCFAWAPKECLAEAVERLSALVDPAQ